ncbi:MAG TPA: hypothetical protein VE080_00035, partial [Candidatus Aquicultoraceae bacterium]|nr:hypothetical protein [Candidatus Aquicultoraceae bacterium]
MTLAARIEARFRFLSVRERILLLLCAVAVAGFVVIRWGIYPAQAEYRKERARIRERQAELLRYRAVRAGEGGVTEELASMVEELEQAEEGILPGSDPSAAGAALQGL